MGALEITWKDLKLARFDGASWRLEVLDGTGDLYGFAWSPNTGWINFGWATLDPGNPHRPRVDLVTGKFHGYAWSANSGWIALNGVTTTRMDITDTDGDEWT